MRREKITRWAGVLVAVVSLALLLVNEGLLFRASPAPIDLSIRGIECAGDVDAVFKGASVTSLDIIAEISGQRFFGMAADLEMKIGFDAFSRADCARVEIESAAPLRFSDNSGFYDSADAAHRIRVDDRGDRLPGPTTTEILVFERNANQRGVQQDWGDPNRTEFVRILLPGVFERLSAGGYATRFDTGGERHRFRFAESYGKTGAGASNGPRTDLSFRLQAFDRISSIITIVFATLLGVGVGAVFEASLILSTARKIEEIRREIGGDAQ